MLSTAVTLGILLLTAGLFFILPRTAEAAISRLISHRVFLPGFSDHVNLGDIGEIKTSSRPVMHVRFYATQAVGPMKWRGAALSEFDGKRWTNPNRKPEMIQVEDNHVVLTPLGSLPQGRHVNYHVDLEALDNDTLFFAGAPEILDLRARALYRSETGGVSLGHPAPPGFRYDAWSLLDDPPERAPALVPPPNWHAASPPALPMTWHAHAPSNATCARIMATLSNCPTARWPIRWPISCSRAARDIASISPVPWP